MLIRHDPYQRFITALCTLVFIGQAMLLCLMVFPHSAAGQELDEYKMKAVFLYSLTNFIS